MLNLIKKNYWQLSDHDLELLAAKYKIGEYATPGAVFISSISRKAIIEQLVFRDKFITSFTAIIISIVALVVSIITIFIKG